MKRILIRLTALGAVVGLGIVSVVLAQRSLQPKGEAEAKAEQQPTSAAPELVAGHLAVDEKEAKHRLDPAADAIDRYAAKASLDDHPSSVDPFNAPSTWKPGARDRIDAARGTAIGPQALEEAARNPKRDAAGADALAGDSFPDAAEVLPPRDAKDITAIPPNPLDTGVVAAAYDAPAPRSGRASAVTKGRGPQPLAGTPGEPTLAPPQDAAQGGAEPRYPNSRERGAAKAARTGTAADATGAGEPAPLDFPLEPNARQIERPAASADNFAPPAAATTAAATEGQTEGTGRPGSKQLDGVQTPTLTIEKSAPQEVQVGKAAVFHIVVRNAGQAPALLVDVTDQIPKGTQLVSTTPRATQNAQGELHWALGTIKPGEEVSLQMELTPLTEGEIGSVATVHFAAESSVRTTATRPQLVLEVKAQPEVMIGDQVTFLIKLSNPGTGAATGVLLQEAVPDSLEHEAGPELEYEVGELKPGESRQLELTMKAVKAGRFTNALFARGEGAARAECKSEIEIIAPALELQIEGPKRRYLDRQATYTVSVSNPGTAAATKIDLLTHLPPGLKFVEANNAGQYDAQTRSVRWMLDELPANEMGSVTLTVLPTEAGEQQVHVEGKADRGLSAKREQVVVVEGVSAILFTVADVADPVEVNGETTYEIKVVNQGTKAATNLQLVAILPAEMKPLSGEGPSRFVIDGQRMLFDPVPQLAPKADTTFKVKAQGLRAGDVRVSVQLLTDEMRTPVTKEESTKIYADE